MAKSLHIRFYIGSCLNWMDPNLFPPGYQKIWNFYPIAVRWMYLKTKHFHHWLFAYHLWLQIGLFSSISTLNIRMEVKHIMHAHGKASLTQDWFFEIQKITWTVLYGPFSEVLMTITSIAWCARAQGNIFLMIRNYKNLFQASIDCKWQQRSLLRFKFKPKNGYETPY